MRRAHERYVDATEPSKVHSIARLSSATCRISSGDGRGQAIARHGVNARKRSAAAAGQPRRDSGALDGSAMV
jgi:hypothetical protein